MRRSDGTLFLVLAAISVSLIVVDSYVSLYAVRKGVYSLTYPPRKLFELFSTLARTNRRVSELSQVAMKLALENARLAEHRRENERLRELLSFEKNGYYSLLAAEVVARDIVILVTNLTVNRGTADGITVGMPVCTRDGIVGKVGEVHVRTSIVQTLYDRNCMVSCIVEPSRAVGILRSMGGELSLTGIPFDADVSPGCEVLSSGLGGIFPEGYALGRVESVSPDDLGLFKTVEIVPHVRFSSVREVFIITHKEEKRLLQPREEKLVKEIIPTPMPERVPEFIEEIQLEESQ
ncbi:hypothetical protein AMJ40_01960 [candidate division TA06 bacterium DG_26]|uniref:Cell shape-determining protein MreC n=1 Tax=candidate division TA06 bacterium DG_26 TaxID=1703771 RepID=A0A0S7WKR3_UNCT6|nr:MAG: hypothetical protein AMJ40_01960 [candidate division TA06 bacterium DG_26]